MKSRKTQIVCYLIFIISFILLLLRCFKGFAWNDECFYLSTVNRFYLGDRMLLEEWNVAQMFAILLVPLMALFRAIFGGTEGIILFFRIAYLIFSGAVSLYIWKVLSKNNSIWICCVAALCNLYYAKLGIATFSYNTLAVEMLLLACVLVYSWNESDKKRNYQIILSGVTLSMAVLSNPGLVLIEILAFLGIVLHVIYTKNNRILKVYLWHVAGILLIAVPMFLWWVKDTSFEEIVICIRHMLGNSDHTNGIFVRVFSSVKSIIKQYLFTIVPYGVVLLMSMGQFIKKAGNGTLKKWMLIIQTILFGINIGLSGTGPDIGVVFIAFTMYGVALFFILGQKADVKAWYWFVTGILSALIFYIASDTGIRSLGTGGLISSIGTLILIPDALKACEQEEMGIKTYRFLTCCVSVCIVLMLFTTAWSRMTYVFRESEMKNLNYQIERGPAKGLYTTWENKEEYNLVYDAVMNHITEEDVFFVTKMAPWAYLCTDAECGGYSTWLTRFDSEVLKDYYQTFPDKIPNKILILDEKIGYKNEDNPRGGILEEIVTNHEAAVSVKELECGQLIVIH